MDGTLDNCETYQFDMYLKILDHGIPYNVTFMVTQNNVLDCSSFMFLGWLWLWDIKVLHDWRTNITTTYKVMIW